VSETPGDRSLPWTGERFLPYAPNGAIELEHLHRYLFARQIVAGKAVLDIACGEGYGTALLARSARVVFGVDISDEAVRHASSKYQSANIEFRRGSCAAIPLEDASVDVVVSFETIEHHDQHEAMMREIKRVLRPHGLLVISSPDKAQYSDKTGYRNRFHVRELYRVEFEQLLSSHFASHEMFGQRIAFGSVILGDGAASASETYTMGDQEAQVSPGLSRPVYLIAVASDGDVPALSGGLLEPETQGARRLRTGAAGQLAKIGVMTPTYNRPDLARFLLLQMANQTRRPDLVCIHQNGTPQSYEWAIADVTREFAVQWIHNAEQMPQHEWYAVPLARLIDEGCSHFFWCDHDDLYDRTHIAAGVATLGEGKFDFSVNRRAGCLLLKTPYQYFAEMEFKAHDPGGMSSSMCFNRDFAIELLKDLRTPRPTAHYSDQVLRRVTMPKFRCHLHDGTATTTYVSHAGTVSSRSWVEPKPRPHRSTRQPAFRAFPAALPAEVCDGIASDAVAQLGDSRIDGRDWPGEHWVSGLLFGFARLANEAVWHYPLARSGPVRFLTPASDVTDHRVPDHLPDGLRPKFTVIANLSVSNDSVGGDLWVKDANGNTIHDDALAIELRRQGTVVVIPHHLRYTVRPVTSGVKYSVLSWVFGP